MGNRYWADHTKRWGKALAHMFLDDTAGTTEPFLRNSVAKLMTQFSCGLHVVSCPVEKV